ncbi:hypothetical protein H5410_002732 [Solanum commersonii]|uniref:Uncharacterized protein n=1 Tax=Solanum commersonii TaxID=4109 RepID=A0A9J6B3P6_SOLCO|nr:hypothetical protein H5410_002732 [Solanum commersonii]
MRRVEISIKVLRWLISVFIEASKVQGESVKRWKIKDLYSDFFCTLKYNENGRYINFIAIQGQKKAVIITPESSYNGGWGNITHKIAKFTYEPTTKQKTQSTKAKALGVSFKEAVRNNRWTTESTKKAHILVEEDETTLKNHMHWARIKVRGDGKMVPKEIEVTSEGFVFTVPIWCEAPVTF